MPQTDLFEHEFRTARPSRPLFCHQEFLDKLAARRNDPIGKRTSLLLQRMAVDTARLHYKGTHGVNRGWRRSRLGGSSGSHFYAWWAPAGAAPLKGEAAFDGTTLDAVFLRDIRHHDDHSLLTAGSFKDDYLQLNVEDLRTEEYAPEPWTTSQVKFATSHSMVRILKGHPGSGKTTALLHAADSSHAERVLYVTFSPDLAALARDHFDRFCSRSRTFTVLTYEVFLQRLAGSGPRGQLAIEPKEARALFRRDLQNYQRQLGSWSSNLDALYDEMYAHLVGAAMPEPAGRFPKAERVRLPDSAYRSQRDRYLGTATTGVIEAFRRLDKNGEAPVADRYFPELARAWRVAQSLNGKGPLPAFSGYGCIAVDEVQDLTPLEAYVVLKLAQRLNESAPMPLLLAGDEAQTVRPTDFEWAWLNDMAHSMVGQPQEFNMPVNLRSPRQIANLVNRSWDFYEFLDKQDRPSGAGYAEIEDDSPDQILYAAMPAVELPTLLGELAQREGLAMIAFDKTNLPKETLPFVLSPSEAKGLDFHSVCVLNGGPLLRGIIEEQTNDPAGALGKRLAIDQMRVVLSRPTERLVWLDVDPDFETVQDVGYLLRSTADVSLMPISADALRTSLEEEELDVEERIQRCQRDARQLLMVKPDMAWSRAHQAVALLGTPGELGAVTDENVRKTAQLTLSEVCFLLAFRKQELSPELGQPDLFVQSYTAAMRGENPSLTRAIRALGFMQNKSPGSGDPMTWVVEAIGALTKTREMLPGWFLVEVTPKAPLWSDELERNLNSGDNAVIAQRILPPFFDAMGLADAEARKERLAERCVQVLMKAKKFEQALEMLEALPEAKAALRAEWLEEMGEFARAAEIYLELGDRVKALHNYRSVPDFEAALKLVREFEDHPAQPSLEWLSALNDVLERRPEEFNRTMTTPEKKLLESMLERGLGVHRKKAVMMAKKKSPPVVKKAAVVEDWMVPGEFF